MIDAMYNGITGLTVFEKALDMESNNISNVNTIGFKSNNISFENHMYQKGIGLGVDVSDVDKNFNQGNLKVTDNPFDLAIEGKGFFVVKGETEELHYTRAGNFRIYNDGTIRLPNDYKVQGIQAKQSEVLSTDNNNIFTSLYENFIATQVISDNNLQTTETINARSTNYNESALDDLDINSGNFYKTKIAKIQDIEGLSIAFNSELSLFNANPNASSIEATSQTSDISYDLSQLNNSFDVVEITIGRRKFTQSFDNDGLTTLKKLSDQISQQELLSSSVDSNGKLSIISMLPGKKVDITNPLIINGTINATPLPEINTVDAIMGSGKAKIDAIENSLKDAIENANAKYLRINSKISDNELNISNISSLQTKLTNLNITDNQYGEVSIENDIVYVKQNGNKFIVGKVITGIFDNEFGLKPEGGNLYSANDKSGLMKFATKENNILSRTLELSNSDLSESLVALMTFQKSFEANSKSITTSDDFLKTAIQLKK